MRRRALFALASAALAAACSSDPSGQDLTDPDASAIGRVDAGSPPEGGIFVDSGGGNDAANVDAGDSGNDAGADAGADASDAGDASDASDAGSDADAGDSGDAGADAGDVSPPATVADLAATTLGHTSIGLGWTAPADLPTGNVTSYELRYSKTNITTPAEFAAATLVTTPAPKSAGSTEALVVTGLEPNTTYYFALVSKDAAGNTSALSNVAMATTKARATVLLTEIAMANATAGDFVELVVTSAGTIDGLVVRHATSPMILHTFANLDVAIGDRIVVHLTGLPGPTGFAQEDATKDKTSSTETAAFASNTAWDVYSSVDSLPATDDLVEVMDGATVMDAVAYSARGGDASATAMTAFADAKTAAAWTFGAAPADGVNDCETQRDAVGISSSIGNGACGRMATAITAGVSINRLGTTDTNGKKDWYVAAQTPGASNATIPAATITSVVATSLTSVALHFDQEIDGATVAPGAFTGSGLTISTATLDDAARIALGTSTQNGPHTIGIAATLKTIYGGTLPSTARFCGYEPLGGMIALTEVNPLITGADLVELQTTRAGAIGGFGVRANPTAGDSGALVGTMPAGMCVALGDIVVVHLQPAALPAMPNETLAKDEVTTEGSYYATAWDVRGGSAGLVGTDAVIAVRDAASTYVDALAYSNADGTSSAGFQSSLAYVQSLGLWMPADCGGAACTDATTPTAQGISVSLAGVGNAATSDSLRKSAAGAARTAASWTVGAQSFGATNP